MLRKGVERIITAGLKAGMPVTGIAQAILFYTESKTLPQYAKAGFDDLVCWFNDDPVMTAAEDDNETYATIMIFATNAAEGSGSSTNEMLRNAYGDERTDLLNMISRGYVFQFDGDPETAAWYEKYFKQEKGGTHA